MMLTLFCTCCICVATGIAMSASAPVASAAPPPALPSHSEQALRAQKLFDAALTLLKTTNTPTATLHASLKEAYDAHLALYGTEDLKTARVAWQLASCLLSQGQFAQAEPLLHDVLTTREKLLPPTSDELYDAYADASAVHLLRAQSCKGGPTAAAAVADFAEAMRFAQKAQQIVSLNANNSTSERFHSRMALICSRLGCIHRATGRWTEARSAFERAYDTAERLQMDLPRNVRVFCHAAVELASHLAAERQKKARKASTGSAVIGDAASAAAASAAGSAPRPAAPTSHNAANLYEKAISTLQQHAMTDLPLLAHAQAGLALQHMADADVLHQQLLKQPPPSVAASADATTSSSPGVSIADEIKALLRVGVKLTNSALKLYVKLGGEEAADAATMCYNLSSLHVRLGELQLAKSLLSRALQIRTKHLGLNHPVVVKIREELAKLEKQTAPVSARAALSGSATERNTKRSPAPAASEAVRPTTGRKGRKLVASGRTASSAGGTSVQPSPPAGALTSRPSTARAPSAAMSGSQSARGGGAAAARLVKASPATTASNSSTPASAKPPAVSVALHDAATAAVVQVKSGSTSTGAGMPLMTPVASTAAPTSSSAQPEDATLSLTPVATATTAPSAAVSKEHTLADLSAPALKPAVAEPLRLAGEVAVQNIAAPLPTQLGETQTAAVVAPPLEDIPSVGAILVAPVHPTIVLQKVPSQARLLTFSASAAPAPLRPAKSVTAIVADPGTGAPPPPAETSMVCAAGSPAETTEALSSNTTSPDALAIAGMGVESLSLPVPPPVEPAPTASAAAPVLSRPTSIILRRRTADIATHASVAAAITAAPLASSVAAPAITPLPVPAVLAATAAPSVSTCSGKVFILRRSSSKCNLPVAEEKTALPIDPTLASVAEPKRGSGARIILRPKGIAPAAPAAPVAVLAATLHP
jgi:tetratricopeptide (TPR) repeat protein